MSKHIKVKVTTYVTIVDEALNEYTDSESLEEQVENFLNNTKFIADDPYGFNICTGVGEYEIVDTGEDED